MASPSRSVHALAAAVLLVAAVGCGSDGDEVVAGDASVLPIGVPEAADGATTTTMWQEFSFVAADALPAMGGARDVHRIAPDPDSMQLLSERLGADITTPPASALQPPTLLDLHGSWMYWDTPGSGSSASATCDSSGNCTDNLDDVPENVTQEEAEAIVADLLDGVGVDLPSTVSSSASAGVWNVVATYELDGHEVFGLRDQASVGDDATIEYAMGFSGTVEALGAYPTIDTAEALERLNNGWFGSGRHTTDIGPDSTSTDIVDPVPPADTPETTTTILETDPSAGEPPGSADPPPPRLETPPPVPVTLVEVAWTLVATPAWDRSGVYIVPAYVFTGDDGVDYWVLAIEDDSIAAPSLDEMPSESEGGSSSPTEAPVVPPAPPITRAFPETTVAPTTTSGR